MLRPTLVALLVACGGKTSDSGPVQTNDVPPVLPTAGTWQVVFDQKFSDSCDPISNQYNEPTLTISVSGANTFDLADNFGDSVKCTITGGVDVTCAESVHQWQVGADINLSDVIEREAEMISETEMDLRFNVEMDCEGAGCNNYGAYQGVGWPCDFVQRSTATFVSR